MRHAAGRCGQWRVVWIKDDLLRIDNPRILHDLSRRMVLWLTW
jgi:hypothetical protein